MIAEKLQVCRLPREQVGRLSEIDDLLVTYFHPSDAEDPRWAKEAFLSQYPNLEYRIYTAQTDEEKIVSFLACCLIPLQNDEYILSTEWRLTLPEYRRQDISASIFNYARDEIISQLQTKDSSLRFIFGETVNSPAVEISSNKQGRKRIYCSETPSSIMFHELPYIEPTDQLDWTTGIPLPTFDHIPRHLMIEHLPETPIQAQDIVACVSANYRYIHHFPLYFFNTPDGFDRYNADKEALVRTLEQFLTRYPALHLFDYNQRIEKEHEGYRFIHHDVE